MRAGVPTLVALVAVATVARADFSPSNASGGGITGSGISGSGAANQVTRWSGASSITGSAELTYGDLLPSYLAVQASLNSSVGLAVVNANAGTAAASQIDLSNGTGVFSGYVSGTGYTPSGLIAANQAAFAADAGLTGGLLFTTGAAAAPIVFAQGGTATINQKLRMSSTVTSLYDPASSGIVGLSVISGGALEVPEIAAPGTPASGFGRVYEKTDGKLYFKDDAGVEYDLTATGTGTITGSGAANQVAYFTGASAIASSTTLTFPPTVGPLTLTIAQDAATRIGIENTSAGTSARAYHYATNGAGDVSIGILGTGATAIGFASAGDAYIDAGTSVSKLAIGTSSTSDPIVFGPGFVETIRMTDTLAFDASLGARISKSQGAPTRLTVQNVNTGASAQADIYLPNSVGGLNMGTLGTGAAALGFATDAFITIDTTLTALGIGTNSTSDPIIMGAGFVEALRLNSTEVIVNDTGLATLDFRVASDTQTHALFLDSSLDSGHGRWGFFDSTPDALVDIEGGTLPSTIPAFRASGTLSTSAGSQIGAVFAFTGAGTTPSTEAAIQASLAAGYTGAAPTYGITATNASAGTAAAPIFGSSGNFGTYGSMSATTVGSNVGAHGRAGGGNVNYGVAGVAIDAKASAVNVGVLGLGRNSGGGSPIEVGGFFGYQNEISEGEPGVNVSAVIVADNAGSTANPIFLGRQNGSTVFALNASMTSVAFGTGFDRTASGTYAIGATNITTLSLGRSGQTTAIVGALSIAQDSTLADGVDWVLNTTTGSKIGTATSQKLGFYNATPVVQGASVADATGGAIIDAECRTAVNALISRIEATGLIATTP